MFLKSSPEGKIAILIVYVDDIILIGNDAGEIVKLKKLLVAEFEIKDLSAVRYFLGMEVARSKEGIVISQWKYILDLLNETGMLGCKPADMPMDPNRRTERSEESVLADRGRYQRLVGKLIYLSHTRPDIAYSISVSENREIEIYMDASWAGELTKRRSTTGYCSYVWVKLILISLKIQCTMIGLSM
ncbi:hypothetical protein UlMin_004196 [Ulmus minor]